MNKITAVIIEDEIPAARRLNNTLNELRPEWQITVLPGSVKKSVEWFAENPHPDLVFLDIQLTDGISFTFIEQAQPESTIIFTTAYDEYAIRAFKLNGIDYLLKPIQEEDLRHALDKFSNTRSNYSKNQLAELKILMNQFQQSIASSMTFISYRNDKLIPVPCEDIACFYTKNNLVLAVTEKAEYTIDECMEDIEVRLPGKLFYRANRQFIVQRKFIANARQYSGNRLLLCLTVPTQDEIIISREKVSQFKVWLAGD